MPDIYTVALIVLLNAPQAGEQMLMPEGAAWGWWRGGLTIVALIGVLALAML